MFVFDILIVWILHNPDIYPCGSKLPFVVCIKINAYFLSNSYTNVSVNLPSSINPKTTNSGEKPSRYASF